ncbi:hypothetical protein Vafri_3886 [Volvox africanus]|uniref:Prolyl 4-hydroxylase alpha subunit domain-containing protein n=1 Tax=Volvox africanus TaxID=51714 RepID=A0A8J4EU67_9CHLO|nr:hypothetical protein Vafri_3886 [Volvox africanus]
MAFCTAIRNLNQYIYSSLTASRRLLSASVTAGPEVSAAFERSITPEVAQHLNNHGYAVVDGVFGRDMARQLRSEVLHLYEQGLMHKNCTHLVKDNATSLVEKSHIHEAELTLDSGIQAAAPLCAALNSDRTLATLLSLFLPQLTLDSQAIKLQYNAGSGGCFPMHYDSDEQLDGRRVTAIFYLNPGYGTVLSDYSCDVHTAEVNPELETRGYGTPKRRAACPRQIAYAGLCCRRQTLELVISSSQDGGRRTEDGGRRTEDGGQPGFGLFSGMESRVYLLCMCFRHAEGQFGSFPFPFHFLSPPSR